VSRCEYKITEKNIHENMHGKYIFEGNIRITEICTEIICRYSIAVIMASDDSDHQLAMLAIYTKKLNSICKFN